MVSRESISSVLVNRADERQARSIGGALPRAVTIPIASALAFAAVALGAAFIAWGNRYNSISYQAAETSTLPNFPNGFLATGALVGTSFVIVTAVAIISIVAVIAGKRMAAVRADSLVLSAVGALLAAAALPTGVLEGYLATLPALGAISSIVLAFSSRRGGVARSSAEVVAWGAVVVVADALFSGLGLVVALLLGFTRLRRGSVAQRWVLTLFAILVALTHVLMLGGGPVI